MKKIFLVLGLFNVVLNAAAPQVKTPAPGFYRFMVGDTEVTTLFDGSISMEPAEVIVNIKPAEILKLLSQASAEPAVPTSINAYLINTGTKLVLVDAGAGNFMGPGKGLLLQNLKASGYQPEQVDEIYLTHMHSDHLGALTTEGKKNFPEAVVRMDKRESDYWLSAAEAAKVTNPIHKSMFANAVATLAPYQTGEKFKPFDKETELVPGVRAYPAYGHTPGHTVYTVESKNKKLWLVGDMVHVAAVQFPRPKAGMVYDWNGKLAVAERLKDFAQVAKNNDLIAAAHIAFPGVGHLQKSGSGFVFNPLIYAPLASSRDAAQDSH